MSRTADEDIRWMNSILERARATDEHGHAVCPMCGGRAQTWLERDQPDGWSAAVKCFHCGMETEAPDWTEATQEDAERRAWEEWDRAWWRGGR